MELHGREERKPDEQRIGIYVAKQVALRERVVEELSRLLRPVGVWR